MPADSVLRGNDLGCFRDGEHSKENVMKKIVYVALGLLILAVAGMLWLRSNLDGIVRQAIIDYGSAMTKAEVSVDAVKIDAASGEGTISGLTIGNPAGFKTAHAIKVQQLTVAIDPASLAGDVIVIRKIAILSPDVIYEKGESMTNFDAIQHNIKQYTGARDDHQASTTRLIVEEFALRDATAKASASFMGGDTVSVDLPDLTLRNIGKKEGGVSPGELGHRIASAMQKQLTGAISFDKLGKAAKDAAKSVGEAAGSAVDKVKNLF